MEGRMEKRSRVMDVLNGPRGPDFLKCFGDMSLREASKICMVGFSTLCNQMKKYAELGGPELQTARSHPSKWQDIKDLRERMIMDDEFKSIRDILLLAARYKGRGRSVCKPTLVSPLLHATQEQRFIQENQPQDFRQWTLFTSLNQQQRPQLTQQQTQMIGFARQAMQIVNTLPPPSKTTPPIPVLSREPMKVLLPESPQKPISPKTARKRPPRFSAMGTQATSVLIEEAKKDHSLAWKIARPRDINRASNPPLQTPGISREVDVRPWMIIAHCAFVNTPMCLTADQIQEFLNIRYASLMTPRRLRCPLESATCSYGMESVLVPDPTLDALPDIEPITDWGWLVTMGLAQ